MKCNTVFWLVNTLQYRDSLLTRTVVGSSFFWQEKHLKHRLWYLLPPWRKVLKLDVENNFDMDLRGILQHQRHSSRTWGRPPAPDPPSSCSCLLDGKELQGAISLTARSPLNITPWLLARRRPPPWPPAKADITLGALVMYPREESHNILDCSPPYRSLSK